MKVPIVTNTGISGSTTVSDSVFAAEVNKQLLAQAILVYRSNGRQGTSATKTRSAVSATTKKWFKQKGTGNARHGAKSAPIFVGGGRAHGPKANSNWSKGLTKVLKRKALESALSAQSGIVFVSDYLNELTGKTQEAAALLAPVAKAGSRILVVVNEVPETTLRALKNLKKVITVPSYQLTALHVAQAQAIVFTSAALADVEARINDKPMKTVKNIKAAKAAIAGDVKAKKSLETQEVVKTQEATKTQEVAKTKEVVIKAVKKAPVKKTTVKKVKSTTK